MALTEERDIYEENLVNIFLEDFGRIRDEIDKRSALSAQLLNFQIIVIGALFSGFTTLPK